MGVAVTRDKAGRTRYRITFRRDGRRLVDRLLPAGLTREAADREYARIVSDWHDRERLGIQPLPLISTVAREYARRIAPQQKSKHASDNIRAIAPHILGRTLDQARAVTEDIKAALAHQAAASIAMRVSFVRTLCRYAVKWGLTDRDWGITIERPVVRNQRQLYLDRYELAKILRHMPDARMRRACWQLYYSGLRRGELWSATIENNCYVIPDTKNGSPRIVPIVLPIRKIAGHPGCWKDALSKAFTRAVQRAGTRPYHLHDLRHSTASELLNRHAPLHIVAEILGHKDLRSTRRYAHLALENKREWLEIAASPRQAVDSAKGSSETQSLPPRKRAA